MTRTLSAVVSIAVGLLAAPSTAGAVTVVQNGVHRSIACSAKVRTVRIAGNDTTITVTGRCRSVVVSGSGGHITVNRTDRLSVSGTNARVRARTVDRIDVSGTGARVGYHQSSTGGRASVTVSGTGAHVARS